MKGKSSLPFVFINVATTADGKLAPENRDFIPFGSKRDKELLLELRAEADAVLCGSRTADLFPVNLGPGPRKYRDLRLKNGLAEYNLRVIISGSASLNPKAELFKHRFSPIIVITTSSAPKERIEKLQAAGAIVKAFGKKAVDFKAALIWLRTEWKVKRLLCEGGGEINAGLLRAGLVHEIYQTLCPVIFGGRNAPTLADGVGIENLADAIPVKLKSMKRVGDELYLVWRVLN